MIICSGGRFIKKLPGIEHAITPCEGVSAAMKIRDRLKALHGGLMFEFLFGLDQQLRLENRRDRFKLIFFTPAQEPANALVPRQ